MLLLFQESLAPTVPAAKPYVNTITHVGEAHGWFQAQTDPDSAAH